MEMKYILYSKVHKIDDAGEKWTYKYRPVGLEYAKVCVLTVSSDDPYGTIGTLGLPQEKGDIISLNIKEKNVQAKLKPGDKKAVDLKKSCATCMLSEPDEKSGKYQCNLHNKLVTKTGVCDDYDNGDKI